MATYACPSSKVPYKFSTHSFTVFAPVFYVLLHHNQVLKEIDVSPYSWIFLKVLFKLKFLGYCEFES